MSDTATQTKHAPFNEDTPHILIVDDDRRIRELLKKYLSDNGYRVSAAENAREARSSLNSLAYDLIVLDVMMPGETGLELTQSLRETSTVPILLLTAQAETEHRITGLETGADDYLPKPFEPRELLARIRAVIRRHEQPNQADSQSDSLTFGRLSVFPDSHEVTIDDEPVRLTTHQFQLLHYFATHSGKVLNREQLWQAMPNDDSSDNIDRAIDVHISRLRALIEDNPRQPKRIITVRGVGYQFATDQV